MPVIPGIPAIEPEPLDFVEPELADESEFIFIPPPPFAVLRPTELPQPASASPAANTVTA